jgi:murein DD-endopeptidase MepM/ murein hydrolase activator NlpD
MLPLLAAAGLGAALVPPEQAPAWQMPVVAPVSQGFGCTAFEREPPSGACPPQAPFFHSGVDLAAPSGTPVQAVGRGVARIPPEPDPGSGYGKHVLVEHGPGLSSRYAHLSAILVARGAPVAAGQVIGLVGSTGNSTGPHLHFEIHVLGKAVDPVPWLQRYTEGGDAQKP